MMDMESYRREIEQQLSLQDGQKRLLAYRLKNRLADPRASRRTEQPYMSPYINGEPPEPPRDPRRWLSYAGIAAAVLFLVSGGWFLLTRQPSLAVGDGGTGASGIQTTILSTTGPASWASVTAATETDDSTEGTTAANTTSSKAAEATTAAETDAPPVFDPQDPLATLRNGTYVGQDIPRDQAIAIFEAMDSLQAVMPWLDSNVQFEPGLTNLYFTGMMEQQGGRYYVYYEDFENRTFELRVKENGTTAYELLASKPMAEDYNKIDVYDTYVKETMPYNIMTLAQLDEILAAGHVAPFADGVQGGDNGLSSGWIWMNDAKNTVAFSFYLPEKKATVHIYEDYANRVLFYTLSQVDNYKFWDENVQRDGEVPLSPDANMTDYPSLHLDE